MRKLTKLRIFRWTIQIAFLIFIVYAGIAHQIKGGGPGGSASVDALCPFGGLETLYSIVAEGNFIPKIQLSSLVLLIGILLLTIIAGRFFCGWICPLGTIQQGFSWMGRKIFRKNYDMPVKIDKPLRYLKYVLLILTVFLTWITADLVIRPYDPWVAFMHISTGTEVFSEFLGGSVAFILFIILGSMLFERFWCKYLCPLGAVLGIVDHFKIIKLSRDANQCINCKKCDKSCPMGVNVSSTLQSHPHECIGCLECKESCPLPSALNTGVKLKRRKVLIPAASFIIIGLLLFFGIYGLSKAAGLWQTQDAGLTPVSSEEDAVKSNPDDIKGYMTLGQVSEAFGIPLNDLLQAAGLPDSIPGETKLKDLEKEYPQYEVNRTVMVDIVQNLLHQP